MKEDYITLKFSALKPVYFSLGDYIDNEIGVFELVDLYKPDYNAETEVTTMISDWMPTIGNGRIRSSSILRRKETKSPDGA